MATEAAQEVKDVLSYLNHWHLWTTLGVPFVLWYLPSCGACLFVLCKLTKSIICTEWLRFGNCGYLIGALFSNLMSLLFMTLRRWEDLSLFVVSIWTELVNFLLKFRFCFIGPWRVVWVMHKSWLCSAAISFLVHLKLRFWFIWNCWTLNVVKRERDR